MSTEPSIGDLKSAFAAQLSTLPPPAEGRHEHYRPRTRGRTLTTAGAAFVAVVTVTSAAVTIAGWEPATIASPPSTPTTAGIDGTPSSGPSADSVVTVEGAAGEPVAEIPMISTEEQMRSYSALPLDAYSLANNHRPLLQAYDKLLAECVAEQGLDLGPYRVVFPDPEPRRPRLAERYGMAIMAEARQYGYQSPPYSGPTQQPPPPPLSPEEEAALDVALRGPAEERLEVAPPEIGSGMPVQTDKGWGFAPDSCIGRAWAALEVVDSTQLYTSHGSVLVADLVRQTFHSAEADSRVTAVFRAWSACLAEKGFDATEPDELALAYSGLDLEAQIPAAAADVECRYATNYFGVRYGVDSAYQKAAIEENAQELEEIAAAHRVTLDKAMTVLNE